MRGTDEHRAGKVSTGGRGWCIKSGRPEHKKKPKPRPAPRKSFPIVGIGASAGGLETFTELLKYLPTDTGMAFVLVQHLDPKHASLLTELLHKATEMVVAEVQDGMKAEPDHVYVIPPNSNLAIFHGVLRLMPRAETRVPHLPIDYFFRSLALDQATKAIGVVLSGTASDGAEGLKEIKSEGGITFAQDPESAKYDGMPRAAVAAGAVDFVLPTQRLAKELARIGRHPYPAHKKTATAAELLPTAEGDLLDKIFIMVREQTGVDFANYKQSTIKRRIARRMALLKLDSIADYANYLRDNPSEAEALYQDILITVTSFFREPEAFEALEKKVFPVVVKDKGPDAPIRIWVPGCSTGEEAYSLAISLLEFLEETPVKPAIQIFATDLNEKAIAQARVGIYPESISDDLSPERLRRFFVRVENGYQISKSIREMCVFARHDVTKDPPFSRVDLISCRNLLIYLRSVLQNRIIPMFHYALKPQGWLLLGASESVGASKNLFSPVDAKRRVFVKKTTAAALPAGFAGRGHGPATPVAAGGISTRTAPAPGEFDIQKEADRLILTEYAPAGVIINDDMEIVQFRGQTGLYLEPAPGKASLGLLKMAREGLGLELRTAVAQAKKTGAPVAKEAVRVGHDGKFREINIEVAPIQGPAGERYFLVLFKDLTEARGEARAAPSTAKKGRAKETAQSRRLAQLEQELAAAKDRLQTIIQERDANNEELGAANEELQSTNEELETSEEELQSTNEELTTVNDELQNRNFELARLNDDLANLLTSVNIPMIMVDHALRVRRFTVVAEDALNLVPADVGRPLDDIKLSVNVPRLAQLVTDVIDNITIAELEMKDKNGRWFSMRVRPYKTSTNEIEGAVITFVDIDKLKRTQQAIEEARDYAEAIVDTVREPLLVLDTRLHVISANPSFYRDFKALPGETEGKLIYELGNGQWSIPELRELLEEILPQNNDFSDFEVVHDFPQIGQRIMRLNARRIAGPDGGDHMILLAIDDITERRRTEEQYKRAIATTLDGFWIVDEEGRIVEVNDAYCRLSGYDREELLAMRVSDIDAQETAEEIAGRLRALKETGSDHFETRHRRQDGRLVDFEITATYSPVANGFYIFIHDITERNKAKALSDAVNDINMTVSSTLGFSLSIEVAIKKALKAIGCEADWVVLREDNDWVVRYASGLPQELVGTRLSDEQGKHLALVYRTMKPLVVADTRTDKRVDRRLMKKIGVRSLTDVPLIVNEEVIGVLGFHYLSSPVPFTETQLDFARKVAASLAMAIANTRLFEAEHEIAETLQEAILTMAVTIPGVAFGHLYQSATEATRVGGDFYDLFELEHERVGIVIGDVAGKGLKAAALTSLVKSTIKAYAFDGLLPAGVMAKTNDVVTRTAPEAAFVTAFFGILDKVGGQLTYCCAGHWPAIIQRKDGTVFELEPGAPVLGMFAGASYSDRNIILQPAERLVLYTDGVTEARRAGKLFGEDGLMRSIMKYAKTPTEQLPRAVFKDVAGYTSGIWADDVALLTVSLKA